MKSFIDIFNYDAPAIIAEIKFASPTKPTLYQGNLTALEIAEAYLKNGAAALSVLTEPHYFKGNIESIREIKKNYPHCFILQKDFILHENQVIQAKEYGADAILLMAKLLPLATLKRLYDLALSLNLCPLVEVHTLKELQEVLPLNPIMVGINNRNLETGEINLQTAEKLIASLPPHIPAICESGITNGLQIKEMSALGFKGFLIGTTLMQHPHPGQALHALINEVNGES